MLKSTIAALVLALPFGSAPAVSFAEAVVVNPPSSTVVVKPAPKPSTVVVAPKQDCDTTVVKKEGPVRDKTTITKEC